MTIESNKQDVLKIRIDAVTLQLLEQARGYIELDRSKFIRQSIREKAETIISEHEKFTKSPVSRNYRQAKIAWFCLIQR
jgi:uncharacterized protein (DUF1778 family)